MKIIEIVEQKADLMDIMKQQYVYEKLFKRLYRKVFENEEINFEDEEKGLLADWINENENEKKEKSNAVNSQNPRNK